MAAGAPSEATLKDSMSYKLRKEAFVSNLSGSSLIDINLVTYVAASAVFLYTVLARRGLLDNTNQWLKYTIDFLINVCAVLFVFTVYSGVPLFLSIALIAPALIWLLPLHRRSKQVKKKFKSGQQAQHNSKDYQIQPGQLINRQFLTNYRGTMLLATTLAILAVDFRIFPRRFAKVETWGTSLMDLGVGSFVFSAGVVGARTLISEQQAMTSSWKSSSFSTGTLRAIRHSLPLLALGLARLISVKNLDYAEHVTEYGVHWNFFFTLGFMPPFVQVIDLVVSSLTKSQRGLSPGDRSNSKQTAGHLSQGPQVNYYSNLFTGLAADVSALLVSTIYEITLDNTALLPFVLISPRTPNSSLLRKNAEGVFSFFGYLAIFLAGRATGQVVCQIQPTGRIPSSAKQSELESEISFQAQNHERLVVCMSLAKRTLFYSALFVVSTSVYNPFFSLTVSRRLANLPYVLWIIAYNDAQILIMALIEHVTAVLLPEAEITGNKPDTTSSILSAFNRNGLALFLLANLGTGLVNLTVNTLDTSNLAAMAVLILYAGVLSATAVVLDKYRIKIKL